MKRLLDKMLMLLGPVLASFLIRCIYIFLKAERVGFDELGKLWSSGKNVILVGWHDQLLMMPPIFEGRSAKVLISQSKDGELIARTIAHFSIGAVRGSSSRGGREALKEMKLLANEPMDLGITPDGPKGPRHVAKFGVVQLARVTGRPVVPIAFACSRGYRFNSWDRFLLPFPSGKAVYYVGQPLYTDDNELAEDFHTRIQQAMDDNTRQAMEYLKKYDVSAI